MKEVLTIGTISVQLSKVCAQIDSLTAGILETEKQDEGLASVYESLLLDEIKHAQILTLEMTRIVTKEEERTDEGVFAEGELTSNLGEKEDE